MTAPGFRIVDQAQQRRSEHFEDAHGRVWFAETEVKTGDEVGGFYPVGWQAPESPFWCRGRLVPDKKYLTIKRTSRTAPKLHIDYDRWLADHDAATREWQKFVRDIVRSTAGNPATEVEWFENPPKSVLHQAGPSPEVKVPRKLIEAAAAGNKWALGMTDAMPSWALTEVERWERMQPEPVARVGARSGAEFPDAEDEVEQDDRYGAFEEAADPDAVGGKKIPVAAPKRGRPPKVKEAV